jgi:hypothetical protein
MTNYRVKSKRNRDALGNFAGRLTEKQVESLIFQPWFVPRATFQTIAGLLPREWALRMHDYYDRFGCMYCRRRTYPYGSNGMCKKCVCIVSHRIHDCWDRRLKAFNKQAERSDVRRIVSNVRTARDLLQDLIRMKQSRKVKKLTSNPVNDLRGIAPLTQRTRQREVRE